MTLLKRFLSYFFIFLVCLGLAAILTRLSGKAVAGVFGFQNRAGLKVTSTPVASISVDGHMVGKTPYQNENLSVGDVEVKLESESGAWTSKVKLVSGTITVVNRELTESVTASSGEVLTLTVGNGLTVISNPEGASLEIDGKAYGQTPAKVNDLNPGEHTLLLSKSGYLKRNIKAILPENLALQINIDLSFSDSEVVAEPEVSPKSTATKLKVKKTPTGFLRVRATPSLSGKELTRISEGEELTLVETVKSWLKVKLKNGTEGYVLGTYIEEIE